MKDALRARGAALEETFFRRQDQKLIQQMRDQWDREREAESLKIESGIHDNAVIEELINVGVHPGTLQALTLVPAIHTAWANGFVERKERDAVMKAAESIGITCDSTSGKLLISWLEAKPGPELFATWQDYVTALHGVLDTAACQRVREYAVSTATTVAEAAGRILGMNATSAAEKTAIREIEEAFAT